MEEPRVPRLALGAARVLPGDASALFGEVQRIAERQPVLAFATLLERRGAHTALWAWLRDWSFTARAVIKRRDHLIALGLSGRRRKKTLGDGDGGLQAATDAAVNPASNAAASAGAER